MNRKPNVIIIGDSHPIELQKAINKNKYIESDYFRYKAIVSIPEKTAQGLSKRGNRDLYVNKIAEHIKESVYLGMLFGEIDCAYTIQSRMKRNDTIEDEEIEYSVSQLIDFGRELSKSNLHVFFMGPIIPLMKNYKGKNIPNLILKRRESDRSHKERTLTVLKFNEKLEEESKNNNFGYISINDELIDKETMVAKEFYQKRSYFHHLNAEHSMKLWSNEIERMIKGKMK